MKITFYAVICWLLTCVAPRSAAETFSVLFGGGMTWWNGPQVPALGNRFFVSFDVGEFTATTAPQGVVAPLHTPVWLSTDTLGMVVTNTHITWHSDQPTYNPATILMRDVLEPGDQFWLNVAAPQPLYANVPDAPTLQELSFDGLAGGAMYYDGSGREVFVTATGHGIYKAAIAVPEPAHLMSAGVTLALLAGWASRSKRKDGRGRDGSGV